MIRPRSANGDFSARTEKRPRLVTATYHGDDGVASTRSDGVASTRSDGVASSRSDGVASTRNDGLNAAPVKATTGHWSVQQFPSNTRSDGVASTRSDGVASSTRNDGLNAAPVKATTSPRMNVIDAAPDQPEAGADLARNVDVDAKGAPSNVSTAAESTAEETPAAYVSPAAPSKCAIRNHVKVAAKMKDVFNDVDEEALREFALHRYRPCEGVQQNLVRITNLFMEEEWMRGDDVPANVAASSSADDEPIFLGAAITAPVETIVLNGPCSYQAQVQAWESASPPVVEENFECGCCFDDQIQWEQVVQCREGHLFCKDCVRRYAESVVGGIGGAEMVCMRDGCDVDIPPSQLEYLEEKLRKQISDRKQHDDVRLACANSLNEELVQCPRCEVPALIEPGKRVFPCVSCGKSTCRKCQGDWSEEHWKYGCKETTDETLLRRQIEEEMTMTRVRKCPGCQAPIVKNGGCNKITCRCGTLSCYVCRKNLDGEGYDHFCRHFREPGKGCPENCVKCLLFVDTEAGDRQEMTRIRAEGEEKWAERGFAPGKKIAID